MSDARIAFVDQSGQLGGAELCLADIACGLTTNREVILFANGPFAEMLRARNTTVTIVPLPDRLARLTKQNSLGALFALPAMVRHVVALRKVLARSELIYLNTAKALVHGVGANLDRARPGIFHLHDLLDPHHFSRTNLRLLVAAANRVDAVIANSHATAAAFRKHGGRTPVHVIPNGFDPDAFDRVDAGEVATLRSELNPDNRPVAAIFGRLTRWKGQDVLLSAAAELPDLRIWVVGDALFTEDDRTYADELRRLAAPLGERVRFLGFRSDVPQLMRAADIIVHTSLAPEPFGRVLVEAMLARRPVVATRAGGASEIVLEGETGHLVAPGDVAALKSVLADWSLDESLRRRLGDAGAICARAHYGLQATLAQINAVIDEVRHARS